MRKIFLIAVAVLLLIPAAAFAAPYEGPDELDAGTVDATVVAEQHDGQVAEAEEAEEIDLFNDGLGAALEMDRRDIL